MEAEREDKEANATANRMALELAKDRERIAKEEEAVKEPQALCCCPTRELATQNYAVLTKMGMHCDGLRVQLLVPGMEGEGDRLTAQVLVGTPGKIHQLYAMKRTLRLKQMKVVVFDEAAV